jgi:translation initiation factor 1 (eIF-1/SUI1)
MSEAIRQKAAKGDILFQGDERDKVNEFLKSIADNPEWNKD